MERFRVSFNGKSYEVEVERMLGTTPLVPHTGTAGCAIPAAAPVPASAPVAAPVKAEAAPGASTVCAPMPGKILAIQVKSGDGVKRGDVLLILEAMKMQNEIMAPADGKVADIRVTVGCSVATGDTMVILS